MPAAELPPGPVDTGPVDTDPGDTDPGDTGPAIAGPVAIGPVAIGVTNRPVTVAEIAALLAAKAAPGTVLLVGVTGSVAGGKSTFVAALQAALATTHRTEAISTDGFLLPNATLTARDLNLRKGFPETYDAEALFGAIAQARTGPTVFPGYSHITYDPDPAHARTVDRPDILILEGLGFAPMPDGRTARDHVDVLIYLDAAEEDLETWFVRRFLGFWRAAETDPASFYAQFRTMSETEAEGFARMIWQRINLANLRAHIVHTRDTAHVLLRKAHDHTLTLVRSA